MVNMVELKKAENPSFIGCWMLKNDTLCDEIVDFFEANRASQIKGVAGYNKVNTSDKLSTDLTISPNELKGGSFKVISEYMDNLNKYYQEYIKQWPILKSFLSSVHIGPFNIQKYDDQGHFNTLHAERTALDTQHRVLAWMTYLNDVSAGGQTEFPYFDLKITPEKGKTLIWPGEWTHAHRGCIVEKGPKYIITGWTHFPE